MTLSLPIRRFCGLPLVIAACAYGPGVWANPNPEPEGAAAQSEDVAEPAKPLGLSVAGTVDLFAYRYKLDQDTDSSWDFNGIRGTDLALEYRAYGTYLNYFQPFATLVVGVGLDRGDSGSSKKVSIGSDVARLGVSSPWGDLSYGKQYSVMTNYAWTKLNPLAQGWGSYFNDPLYAGDSFTYGNRDQADLQTAGANFFLGYNPTGWVYEYSNADWGVDVEVDYIPGGTFDRKQGSTKGLGLSKTIENWTFVGALAKQDSALDASDRSNRALGVAYQLTPEVRVTLGHLTSDTSYGADYSMVYGGAGWQVSEPLHLSFGFSRYKQNDMSTNGAGDSLGGAMVAEYAWTKELTLFLQLDRRHVQGGEDGLQSFFNTKTPINNLMLGFYYSF